MADLYAALERLVRAIVGDMTYYKHYPCSVEGQDGMTLDLLPDDEAIRGPGGLQGVPLRVGLPGFEVKVPVGARVMLSFDEGNPAKPAASLFDPNSVTSIHFADGTQAVARQGDLVVSGGVGLVVTLAPVTPPILLPGPLAPALGIGIPYLISFSAVLPTPLLAEPLYGSIATGRPEFTA